MRADIRSTDSLGRKDSVVKAVAGGTIARRWKALPGRCAQDSSPAVCDGRDRRDMNINFLANGLGGQSLLLLALAGEGKIPATVSITADTGSENDRVWNTGERTSSREYYERIVVPLGKSFGIETRIVRAQNSEGVPNPPLHEAQARINAKGKRSISIPVFGSKGGRLIQVCTDRWKMTAIKQELRRMGAKTACGAEGIHQDEAWRRVKGDFLCERGGFNIYQKAWTSRTTKKVYVTKWLTHFYPLVDMRLGRSAVQDELKRRNIPFLISSECDMCPHQDAARWLRHTPESLAASAALEATFNGEYFLTDRRIPLLQAIAQMKAEQDEKPSELELDFGCGNALCGV